MLKKQDGMTLVEVLATLLLTSLVIVLIWTTVAISMKYNVTETKKLQMQQDANYIITDIQRIHRKYECYQIIQENQGSWEVQECSNGKIISVYSNPAFKYELSGQPEKIFTKQKKEEAGVRYSPSYLLTVSVNTDKNNGPSIKVQTTISRIDESTKR
ncbi:hypothetical protein NCCP2222_03780 [Sporosarcina sp. NCCP-2222]|uniref:PilW family protein n=1 Tax=Sporosarcina sp. NCCP-2222 TaxID=2935073 RepID=UPI00207EADA5|nr:prepilin-type N-terminal cleavage/methylation domain-containing protein [Sporosarcina sp. NCCP-2222]GKV54431.1 hypothetical protein NCCP2222_03780 [Sporosarcina sp. NCCP-2222]